LSNRSKTQNPKSKIGWLLLILLIFGPRLLNLDLFLTPDEPLFLDHARQFAAGLASADFSQTLGIGYPGVTVAGWAAPVVGLSQTARGAYVAGRIVTALATGLLLLVFYGLSRTLLGRWPALIALILLALDPYTLSYSRLLHIAAPLALLMSLASVTFLLWLRDSRRRWLLLAGLFTGLALLTKSTALLLGPMLLVVLLAWGYVTQRWRDSGWWRSQIKAGLILAGLAALLFFALWPAMWVDPAGALALTFSKLFVDQEAGTGNLGMFWLGQFVEDPGPAFYPVAFLLKSTPWLLVGLILSIAYFISPTIRTARSLATRQPVTLSLWLLALTYLILMTIASKKSIRYMLPAFPLFYLLAASAFHQTALWLTKRSLSRPTSRANLPILQSPNLQSLLLPLLFLPLLVFTLFYHPYYFSYYNPLLLGWRWAPNTLLVGWGEGLDQAARHLQQQPPPQVSAWYNGLFELLYQRPVQPVVPQENLITAGRTVFYINQVQRDIPGPNIVHYFRSRRRPEEIIRLNGIEYAWIYPGPVAGFELSPSPQNPTDGRYGDELRLLGYDLFARPEMSNKTTTPNFSGPITGRKSLIVTLYWRVLTPPPATRFVYVRLVDADGHIWASADGPPVMGLWPVDRWQPEMFIEDAHELPLPPGMPPGTYWLEVGVYDPSAPGSPPLVATGSPPGAGGGLLLGLANVRWQSFQSPPKLSHYTDVRLAPNARLIGYNGSLPATATTGDHINLQLAWQETSTPFSDWFHVPNNLMMFEWWQNGQRVAEQFGQLPVPLEAVERGSVLLSQHDLIVPPALATGRYELVLMLRTDAGSQPTGQPFTLGEIDVTAPPHQFELPATATSPTGLARLRAETGQKISLAGYELADAGPGLAVTLYWQTNAPVTTGYKIFTQLLSPENTVVAQSDTIPGGGARPTTGWLPGEIITSTHPLHFADDPPPGRYRLITGLYNPVSGSRLQLLDQAGQPVADFITVTEVSLP